MRPVLPPIVLALLLAGCSDQVVFQADVPVPEEAWDRSFTPEFSFDVSDTVQHHDLYIDVRHTGDYPFSDLFLFVDLYGPDDRHLRDTVECLLADPTGRWYGKGTGFIFADRFEAHVLYKLKNRFPASGRYTIKLEQAMRTEQLPGVIDVGVSVERSK
jgi:gliding motility-associated lipoprotein GldH